MKRLALATLLAASIGNAFAADVKLVAVTQVSPTLPQYTRVDQPVLRDGLQKASNGRIEVKLASWPEMNVGGPEVLRLVRSGQVDIAAVPLTTVSGDVPLLDGADLAGMNLEIGQARKVANGIVPYANAELEKLGIKLVATYPFSGQMLFCRKPIAQLTDIKNLKVRTFGPSSTELVKALGGQPVSMAFGEVYTALERGTVDCAITGSGSGNGVKWPEVTTHLYTQPLFWAVSGYFVNLNWWNKLAAQDRALIEKTLLDVQDKQWALGLEATLDGVACNTGKAEGCKIHTLAKRPMVDVAPRGDVRAAIQKELEEDVLPGWLKRCGEKCNKVYAEVIVPITGIKVRH
jgi:TRAP-type C4-dicarboxylate transport system substrate-binding protein